MGQSHYWGVYQDSAGDDDPPVMAFCRNKIRQVVDVLLLFSQPSPMSRADPAYAGKPPGCVCAPGATHAETTADDFGPVGHGGRSERALVKRTEFAPGLHTLGWASMAELTDILDRLDAAAADALKASDAAIADTRTMLGRISR